MRRFSLAHRLMAMHILLFFCALAVMGIVFWGWQSLSEYRYFAREEGGSADIFQGNYLNQLYNDWRYHFFEAERSGDAEAYDTFFTTDEQYRDALSRLFQQTSDENWQQTLADTAARVATFSEQVRALQALDDAQLYADFSTEGLKQAARDLPGTRKPSAQLQELMETFRSLLAESQIAMARYQYFQMPEDLAAVRKYFLDLDDLLQQSQQLITNRQEKTLDTLSSNLSGFFGRFEQKASALQERAALREQLLASFADDAQPLNPAAVLRWDLLNAEGAGDFLQDLNSVSILLTLMMFAALGLVLFSIMYIQKMLEKPLQALTSYTSHAFLTRKRTEVPGHERRDEIGVLARAIQALLVHIDQKLEEESQKPTAPLPASAAPAPSSTILTQVPTEGSWKELDGLLDEAFTFTEDFMRRKTFDHTKSVETGELADQTRQSIQKAALNIHDMMSEYQNMASTCQQLVRKLEKGEQDGKRLSVRLYNMNMAADHFQAMVRTLQGFCQEISLLQHNISLSSYRNPQEAFDQAMTQMSRIQQQYDEVSLALAHESATLLRCLEGCHDAAKAMKKNQDSLGSDVRQLSHTLTQSPAALKSLYEMLQAVSFRVGRLAVVLLEHSADAVKSNAAVHRLGSLVKDLRHNIRKSPQKSPASTNPTPQNTTQKERVS